MKRESKMASYKTTARIERDGELNLHSIPFHSGDQVDITLVFAEDIDQAGERFPLRRTSYRYDFPFEPVVGAQDWDAHK